MYYWGLQRRSSSLRLNSTGFLMDVSSADALSAYFFKKCPSFSHYFTNLTISDPLKNIQICSQNNELSYGVNFNTILWTVFARQRKKGQNSYILCKSSLLIYIFRKHRTCEVIYFFCQWTTPVTDIFRFLNNQKGLWASEMISGSF